MSLKCVAPTSHLFFDQICTDGIQLVPMYFIIHPSNMYGGSLQVYDGEGHLNVPRMCSSYVTPFLG